MTNQIAGGPEPFITGFGYKDAHTVYERLNERTNDVSAFQGPLALREYWEISCVFTVQSWSSIFEEVDIS